MIGESVGPVNRLMISESVRFVNRWMISESVGLVNTWTQTAPSLSSPCTSKQQTEDTLMPMCTLHSFKLLIIKVKTFLIVGNQRKFVAYFF